MSHLSGLSSTPEEIVLLFIKTDLLLYCLPYFRPSSFEQRGDTYEPPPHESSNNKGMSTAFSLPAGRTAKSYVASEVGLGRGLGTAGYGWLTRKGPPEIETAAGRVVPIAIPTFGCVLNLSAPIKRVFASMIKRARFKVIHWDTQTMSHTTIHEGNKSQSRT
ncbi:hypothetical protein F2Q68_00008520 [Brassica cretica]|uniref:Uncharacterized protein n=1 Tax=Brassica cretica TaxID=69181 RepID=A0A8S9KYY2_BRACR|nr:hypothetical protein F2Q68_00008520 [Brassica cretica]